MHLLDLPVELLEEILLLVPPRTLISRVSVTCRRLRELLQNELFWRRRYAIQARTPLPLSESWRHWQLGSVQNEFARVLGGGEGNMHVNTLTGATGGLDCVHMMFPQVHGAVGLVAAGSRDSCLYVWRRRKMAAEESERRSMRSDTMNTLYGHKGWVWCLTSDPSRPELLCSGGWDRTVQVWDVTVGKAVACISKQHRAAVLALQFPQPSCLVSTCYDKTVREFDLRVPISLVADHREHKKPVLALAATEGYVYTAGEDKTVCVWDRRSRNIVQTQKLKGLVTSLHCQNDMLSCSAQKTVSLYDCSHGTLTKRSSFSPQHSYYSSLTCVYHNLGMVTTASKDGTVAIHGPAPSHAHIATLHKNTSDITCLECTHNTLAVASSDRSVTLWTPRSSTWDYLT